MCRESNNLSILQRAVTDLKGVGEQTAAKLANLNIRVFQDVLFHLPYRYVDRTKISCLATVQIDDLVVIEAEIEKAAVIPKPKRNLVIKIKDQTGSAELKFFYFNISQQAQLKPGVKLRCFGQARSGRAGLQFIHPEYTVIQPGVVLPVEENLTPIYSITDGVSQNLLRNLVKQVLSFLTPIGSILELLPEKICQDFKFESLIECLQQLHFPISLDKINQVRSRLAFEELLAHHLVLRKKREVARQDLAYKINNQNNLAEKLLLDLPFKLTNAQTKAINTINQDLAKPCPMLRLVQGDVGSGKTLVAVIAALKVIESGYQVAFMAPTEILAEQHFYNIKNWLEKFDISVGLLTGKLSNKEKLNIKQDILLNKFKLIIGTHALFQDDVSFNNLALVIIDEQHRFGVAQRLALQKKNRDTHISCHQLILTATPIPRTLAMTFYADLDYSIIDELPPGRKPINTVMISSERRAEILLRISNICAQNQQVYWVCTLIEESEVLDCTAAENLLQELKTQLPELNIALIHGKMPADLKQSIMSDFKHGLINLLVATTVIEVGVDVPNASLMVIENPERLGLAQLHQLRGRVGRGNNQSFCVLLYKKPLGIKAAQRLQFLRDSQDGFALAEFDLQLRGAGEIFGTRQSGLANLKIADLMRDKELLPKVAAAAELIISGYPQITTGLIQRWVGYKHEYIVV